MRGRLIHPGKRSHSCYPPNFWFASRHEGAVWECSCGQQWLLSGGYDGLSWGKVEKW